MTKSFGVKMNTQQRAAMQMALENFAKLYNKVMESGSLGHQWTGLQLADGCSESIRAMSEALAQPQGCDYCNSDLFAGTKCNNCGKAFEHQGSWVGLTHDEIMEMTCHESLIRYFEAKLKEKNTPVQREQQEPMAWALMHKNGLEFNTGYGIVETLQQAEEMQRRHLGNLKVVPLYTTPPSVEAAVLAERERCAKVCENIVRDADVFTLNKCAAAIRARG